ncbi:unnamed protein product [Rhizophagus irregularis]|nr:unnamed protein product [Rhizophagus irregularis]
MSSNNTLNDDENFLKNFLKDFYRQIIKIECYKNFENILIEWIQDYLNHYEKNSKKILKLMENHKENENWFSSLIGFFYEKSIGFDDDDDDINIINKDNKFLKLYLLSINNYKNKNSISLYQLLNIIIAKYLLSFYYYKDIILNKRKLIISELNVMSHNQIENFYGLELNLCKDEINTIEEFFKSSNKDSNEKQKDYVKKKELEKLNNLG